MFFFPSFFSKMLASPDKEGRSLIHMAVWALLTQETPPPFRALMCSGPGSRPTCPEASGGMGGLRGGEVWEPFPGRGTANEGIGYGDGRVWGNLKFLSSEQYINDLSLLFRMLYITFNPNRRQPRKVAKFYHSNLGQSAPPDTLVYVRRLLLSQEKTFVKEFNEVVKGMEEQKSPQMVKAAALALAEMERWRRLNTEVVIGSSDWTEMVAVAPDLAAPQPPPAGARVVSPEAPKPPVAPEGPPARTCRNCSSKVCIAHHREDCSTSGNPCGWCQMLPQ